MKKLLVKILIGLMPALFTVPAFANHIIGGDIYYTFLGLNPNNPTQNRYRITAVYYRDCAAVNAAPLAPSYDFGIYNARTNAAINTVTLQQISIQTLNEYAPNCRYPSTYCIEEGVYQAIINLPNNLPNNPGFHVSSYTWKRNTGINNINTTGNGPFNTVNDGLVWYCYIPPGNFNNSSPRFLAKPVPYMCNNNDFVFNHLGFDPDGDSLAFSVVWPYGGVGVGANTNANQQTVVSQGIGAGVPNSPIPLGQLANAALPGCTNITQWFPVVTYQFPYSFPANQFPTLSGININQSTGELFFRPTQVGNFVLCVEVREYRIDRVNGTTTYLGAVRRDLQLLVNNLNCAGNSAPIINVSNTSYTVLPGQTLTFNVQVFDAEGDSAWVTKDGTIFDNTSGMPAPYATMPSDSGRINAQTTFTWTPTCEQSRVSPYFFTIRTYDNFCNIRQQTIFILVKPPDIMLPPDLRCIKTRSNTSIEVNWNSSQSNPTDFSRYIIFRRAGNSGPFTRYDSIVNINTTVYVDNNANNALSQIYQYVVYAANTCNDIGLPSDTMQNMLVQVTRTNSGKSATLSWNTFTLNNVPGTLYRVFKVKGANSTQIATTTSLSFSVTECLDTSSYRVQVNDAGGGCSSSSITDTLILRDVVPPAATPITITTVLTNTQIQVNFNGVSDAEIDSFRIYRSTNGGAFVHIGSVPYNNAPSYTYTDIGINALSRLYRYQTRTVDTCGTESNFLNIHQPVLLNGTPSQKSSILSWTRYGGQSIQTQTVEKLINASWTTLANIPIADSTYTDTAINACGVTFQYRIRTTLTNGQISFSNTRNVLPFDTVKPVAPQVLWASVSAPGQITIAYTPSTSNDVSVHQILVSINNGPYNVVATPRTVGFGTQQIVLNGYNTAASPIRVQVLAFDSCSSLLSDSLPGHTLNRLSVTPSNLKTILNWTGYNGFNIGQYQILRWNPTTSAWLAIGTTPGNTFTYTDTGSLACKVNYIYKVNALENLPQLRNSLSDTASATVWDTVKPDVPLINTVSRGSALINTLSWNSSLAGDVGFYRIYRAAPGLPPVFIKAVTALSAIDTTPTAGIWYYSIEAVDTCALNTSAKAIFHNTISVSVSRDGCNKQVNLKWNRYNNIASGLNKYEIWRADNGGAFNFISNINPTDTTFLDTGLNIGSQYCYRILAVGNNPAFVSASDSVCINILPTAVPTLRVVSKTTAATSGAVTISWQNINTLQYYKYVNIYFANNALGPYTLIQANIPATQLSWVHNGINTLQSDYWYYATMTDSCGNESAPSPIHKTMNLSVSGARLFQFLNWTPYQGFTVNQYQILQQTGTGPWTILGTVPGTNTAFTYYPAPCFVQVNYKVVAYGATDSSLSDTASFLTIDNNAPDASALLNATVLNDLNTRLTIRTADSLDVFAYAIERNLNGTGWGVVNYIPTAGPNQTIQYIDTVATRTNRICYRVTTLDSCLNAATSSTFCVIQATAISQNLQNTVAWQPFVGYPIANHTIEKWNGSVWTAVGNTTDTFWVDQPLPCKVIQTYRVVATGTNGLTTISDTTSIAAFDTIKPQAPVIDFVTVQNPTSVSLQWQFSSSGDVRNYEVWAKSTNTSWTRRLSLGNVNTATVNGLNTVDSNYCFYVIAVDTCAQNKSIPSAQHCTIQLQGNPQNLSNALSWNGYIGFNVVRYIIERRTGNSYIPIDSVNGNITTWVHAPLPCNVPVNYRIRALATSGFISLSDTLTLTPFDTLPSAPPVVNWASVISPSDIQLLWRNVGGDVRTYEVRYFTNSLGPIVAGTTTDTTFTITGLNTNANITGIQVIAIDTCALNRSNPSALHQTIQLRAGAFFGNRSIQLNWTNYIGFNGATMQYIERNVNGNWIVVDSVSDPVNNRTLTGLDCNVPYNLRIRALNIATGFQTVSDTAFATPYDTIPPVPAQLAAVSVINNNTILVSWNLSPSGDANRYRIWRAINGGTPGLITTVTNQLSFTDNVPQSTINNRYSYFIETVDSCNIINISNPSTPHVTINISSASGSCVPAATLRWNAYPWFTNGLNGYRVFRSTNNGPYALVTTLANTDTFFNDFTVSVTNTYCFKVEAFSGTTVAQSDTTCLVPFFFPAPVGPTFESTSVTATSILNGSNVIQWDTIPSTDTLFRSYRVYHSILSANGPWTLLDSIKNRNTTTYTHLNTNTATVTNYYQVRAVDTCYNEPFNVVTASPVNLTLDQANMKHTLHWSQFLGRNVQQYSLEKQIGTGAYAAIFVSSNPLTDTSFTDTLLSCNQLYNYRVIATLDNGALSFSDINTATAFDTVPPDAPALYKASVLNTGTSNGVIEISWKAPAQINTSGYIIYRAVNGGTYFPIANLSDTASGNLKYVDFPLNTVSNVHSYYVIALDSCGNRSDSLLIHQALQLTASAQNDYNNVSWTPYIGFNNYQYRIERKTSGTPWVIVGTYPSDSTQLTDFAVRCDTVYYYRVGAINLDSTSSVLIAYSDTMGVQAFETNPPAPATLTTATVVTTSNTSGQIRIQWAASTSNDVYQYRVFRSSDGVIIYPIITLPANVLSYLNSGINTRDSAYAYRIETIDSCFNVNTLSSPAHSVVRLTGTPRNESIGLNWTAYVGWPVQGYELFRNGQKIAQFPPSTTAYIDTQLLCVNQYTYTIIAINADTALNSASNQVTLSPFDTSAPKPIVIKSVSVTPSNNTVTVQLTASPSFDVKNYNVFRISKGDPNTIIVYTGTDTMFVDSLGLNASNSSYCYYVQVADYCGNNSTYSDTSCTILLTGETTYTANLLIWTPYQGWTSNPSAYRIFRSVDNGSFTQIATLSGNTTQYRDADLDQFGDARQFCYQVKAIENGGFNQELLSNSLCLVQPFRLFMPTAFTPGITNGLNDTFGPIGSYFDFIEMKIFDRWGGMVFTTNNITQLWNGNDASGNTCKNGNYVYTIKVRDFEGKEHLKTGTVTLIK